MSPKERLKAYLHYKKITQQSFAASIGASSGYVNALARGFGPQFEPIVMEKYPDLNIGWIMTGQGEMLNTEEPIEHLSDDRLLSIIESQQRTIERLSMMLNKEE